MIARLRGLVVQRSLQSVILDVGGVGFELAVPLSTSEKVEEGKEAELLTHLHVREDALQLYGFRTAEEKELFLQLIGVSGIGPKIALNLLSAKGVSTLREAIANGDVGVLTSITGVGRKMAERIIVDLREKMGKPRAAQVGVPGLVGTAALERHEEAVLALVSLGFQRQTAEKAVHAAEKSLGTEANVEEVVREALKRV